MNLAGEWKCALNMICHRLRMGISFEIVCDCVALEVIICTINLFSNWRISRLHILPHRLRHQQRNGVKLQLEKYTLIWIHSKVPRIGTNHCTREHHLVFKQWKVYCGIILVFPYITAMVAISATPSKFVPKWVENENENRCQFREKVLSTFFIGKSMRTGFDMHSKWFDIFISTSHLFCH